MRKGPVGPTGRTSEAPPQQLPDLSAEAGIGAAFLLMDLAVRLGQLLPHGPGLVAVLARLGVGQPDVLVDLVTVIAPHHRHELTRRGRVDEVGQRGVNIRHTRNSHNLQVIDG
jgi:hypothetical protein